MHIHALVRNVTSKTQVRCSSGASNATSSCTSPVGEGVCAMRAPRCHIGAPRPQGASRGRGMLGATEPAIDDEERTVAGEFDDMRQRLEAISEELTDLAIQRLRESIDAGGTELPVDERRLTRARRAVEKAAGLLREPDDAVCGAPAGAGRGARRVPVCV